MLLRQRLQRHTEFQKNTSDADADAEEDDDDDEDEEHALLLFAKEEEPKRNWVGYVALPYETWFAFMKRITASLSSKVATI